MPKKCIEHYIIVQQHIPGTFSELNSLLEAEEDESYIILWWTQNMFIANNFAAILHRNDFDKNFPKLCYTIALRGPRYKILYVFSNSDLDAIGFLEEQLGKYQDCTLCFQSIKCCDDGCTHFISPFFLERVLQDAQKEIAFYNVTFESSREGHAFQRLATMSQSVTLAVTSAAMLRMHFFKA